jgi:hypothetical protein
MSRMAWENRLALDTMLAEKEGVFVMIGGQCCTFITNNSPCDATTLDNELAKNSRVDDTFSSLIKQ